MASKTMEASQQKMVKAVIESLVLLDCPLQAMENEQRIKFRDDMFSKPNSKAFEVITYFLFCKLDFEQAKSLFRTCYPIVDGKSSQEFRTISLNWWKKIAEEFPSFDIPRVTPTLLKSPGGSVMIQLMFSFTKFVLYSASEKLGEGITLLPPVSMGTSNILPAQIIALKSACHHERVEALHNMQISLYADTKAKAHADCLIQEYRSNIQRKKKLLQAKEQLLERLHLDSTDRTQTKNTCMRKKTEGTSMLKKRNISHLNRVHTMQAKFQMFAKQTSEKKEVVESIPEVAAVCSQLSAIALAPKVPALLLQQCTSQAYERVGTSFYQAGKLNIVNLLSLFNLTLQLVSEKLLDVGAPNFESKIPFIEVELNTHLKNVNILNVFCETALHLIPNSKKSVEKLKKIFNERFPQDASEQYEESSFPYDGNVENIAQKISLHMLSTSPPPCPTIIDKTGTSTLIKLSPKTKGKLSKFMNSNKSPTVNPKTTPGPRPPTESLKLRDQMILKQGLIKTSKSISAPSTPVVARNKEMKRVPKAIDKLVNEFADYTMQEMRTPRNKKSVTNLTPVSATPFNLMDALAQLDPNAFLPKDRLERTPPTAVDHTDLSSSRTDSVLPNECEVPSLWDTSFPNLPMESSSDDDIFM